MIDDNDEFSGGDDTGAEDVSHEQAPQSPSEPQEALTIVRRNPGTKTPRLSGRRSRQPCGHTCTQAMEKYASLNGVAVEAAAALTIYFYANQDKDDQTPSLARVLHENM